MCEYQPRAVFLKFYCPSSKGEEVLQESEISDDIFFSNSGWYCGSFRVKLLQISWYKRSHAPKIQAKW